MRGLFIPAVFLVLLLSASCVNDNEKDLFPRHVIPDTAIQGQLAWYPLDSSLADKLGLQDSLKLWGRLEYSYDHEGYMYGAVVLDGLKDYLSGFLPLNDTLAVSMWILPMPNFQKAILLDYGIGRFTAGLDAVTTATMPRFRMFLSQDTTIFYWQAEIDFFYWHHLYIEIGDTLNPPRIFVDGYLSEPADRPWTMHPVTDLLYLGRPYNSDTMDTLLFRGYIDDIRIFNKILTEEEIVNLYWDGRPRK